MECHEKQPSFLKSKIFAVLLLFLLAFVFYWPYLTGGFFADDVLIINSMEEEPVSFNRWLGIWAGEKYPGLDRIWWKAEGWGGAFWRPLPSLVMEGSLHLFGRNAFPLHLLSLLLHGGVAACLYLLVRKVGGGHGPALLAGIFFVACEDHSMGVGWISTMTDLWCVQFIMISLLCHVHWLQKRSLAALALSLAMLILSMACKETACMAPVALVLLTFFLPRGVIEGDYLWKQSLGRLAATIRDGASWLPACLILAAYLVTYKSLGMGNLNSLLYIDPFTDPGAYLGHLVLHLPVMWLGTFSPVPLYTLFFFPGLILVFSLAGCLLLAAWGAALWPFRGKPLLLWAGAVYLIALLPQLSTHASERGLYFPMVLASILLAAAAITAGPLARRMGSIPFRGTRRTPGERQTRGTRWTRFVGWVAITAILAPGVILSSLSPWAFLPSFGQTEKELRTALPHIEARQAEHILLLNTSGFMLTLYTWDTLNYLSDRPLDVWLLSAASGVFSLERIGESAFVIRTDRAGWLDNFMAGILRSSSRLKQGQRYDKEIFTATLLELSAKGKDVLTVRFDLKKPLADPGWLFLQWNGSSFTPLDIAALEEGQAVELADTSDLWANMN